MNRHLITGFLALALAVTLIQARQGAQPPAAGPRIGIVDIEVVLAKSAAGQRANADFETGRKAKQAALDMQQEALKRLDAELQKQKPTLAPEEFDKRRQELEKSFVDLQQTYVKLERELAQERTDLIQNLMKQAGPEVERIARSEGLPLILDRTAVLWNDPALDLTERLTNAMK